MKRALAAALLTICCSCAAPAGAQPYLGDTITVAFEFCPVGWLPMNGQLLPITEHDALFQIIGFTYGGDGATTFALPLAEPVMTADRKPLLQCIAVTGIFPSPS